MGTEWVSQESCVCETMSEPGMWERHGWWLIRKGSWTKAGGWPPRGWRRRASASSPRASRRDTALDTSISLQQKLCKTCNLQNHKAIHLSWFQASRLRSFVTVAMEKHYNLLTCVPYFPVWSSPEIKATGGTCCPSKPVNNLQEPVLLKPCP